MPSQQQTGSDTRMYAPRSESNLGYTNDDDDYNYGKGDPEHTEQLRDKKQAEKDAQTDTTDLPHLQLTVPKPEPEMPPMMPGMEEEEEEDPMADQYQEGNQLSAMTGMPDSGNLSIGNATGTMPAPGGTLMTGEPMEHAWSSLLKEEGEEEEEDDAVPDKKFNRKPPPLDLNAEYNRYRKLADKNVVVPNESALARNEFTAPFNDETGFTMSEPMEDAWSSLMKSRLDDMGHSKDKSWKQPLYETAAGGSQQESANPRRAKTQSRYVQPSKKHGLDKSPLSVHRTHLGIATKQPLKLFPQKYGQQMGSQARRKLMGNVPQIPAGHAMGPETTYSPRVPKGASAMAGLPISEPREPSMRGAGFAKSDSLGDIRKELDEVNKKMSEYMHFAQIRRLLRRLKDVAERQESRLKAAASGGPGNNREAGHREGHKTTHLQGATENLNSEDDPKNWGAPSTLFAARGSGRTP